MIAPNLVVANESAGLNEPSEGSFNGPALGRNLEALYVITALDDLKINLAVTLDPSHPTKQFSRISFIRSYSLYPAIVLAQKPKE